MTDTQHLPAQSSVVLLRICDYARRAVAEQARLSAQLDTVLALLLPAIPARTRLVLAGNGSAAVAVLDNPPAALAFAEQAMHAYDAGLGLCIGIDHGPVEVVSNDSNEMLAGDGVATASVMAAAATESGLLVTQNFRTALAHAQPGAEYALVSKVNFSDAGLRTYHVYSLDRLAPRKRRRLYLMISASVFVLLMAATFTFRLSVEDRPRPLAPYLGTPGSAPTVIEYSPRSPHGKR